MSRENFYQEVRTAWRRLHRRASAWIGHLESPVPVRDLALSPLKYYRRRDFEGLSPELVERLDSAVRAFQTFVRSLSREAPISEVSFSEGKALLEDVSVPLKRIILDEWKAAVESLITDAERWMAEKGWPCRRETKTVSESLLEEYKLVRLLAYVDVSHVLIEGISRFALNSIGVAEISVVPSYDSVKVIRTVDGWKVRVPSEHGSDDVSFVDWDRAAFESAIGYLLNLRV